MLHNSLFRRDMLAAMNRNPVIVARRDPHRHVAPGTATPSPTQFALEGPWAVQTARKLSAEKLVADDTTDFLTRLGVKIDAQTDNRILLEIGSAPRGFRCIREPNRIEIHGADASALWAGWVHLENEMRSAGGAILTKGELSREPAWEIQIAPPAWGANYFVPDLGETYLSNDALRMLAHDGANGLLIYGDFLVYAAATQLRELHHENAAEHIRILRQTTERALDYGIRLYFCPIGPKLTADHALFKRLPSTRGARLQHPPFNGQPLHCLCSSDDAALRFHADAFRNLFHEVPELGGLLLIIGGESYYHCFMRAADSPIGASNCPRCHGKLAEDVIANFLKITADAVHAEQPRAIISAWPYSAQSFWSNEPNQLRLIDRLPEGVALLSEIDKDQLVQKDGYTKPIWDYSVDYADHSDRIVAQSLRCQQRRRDLLIKTETSYGIELLHFPYVPAIGRSAKQWQSVRAVRPRAVLQRWGFIGMFDSVAERIGFRARWDPDFAPAVAAMQVARECCGTSAPEIVEAWTHFDRAVSHIPLLTTGEYYIGPAFLGPAHPPPTSREPSTAPFHATLYYKLELQPTFTPPAERGRGPDDLVLSDLAQLGTQVPLDIVEKEFTRARDHAAAGHEILHKLDPAALPPGVREEVLEQKLIGEYLYRTFVTTVSTIRFLRARDKSDHALMRRIAAEELQNTESARAVYQSAPWLNHALRPDVRCNDSLAMVEEKIRLLQLFLKT